MDDFQVGLSSGILFRDDFYESFQAPKYYDFRNPKDPDNIDEWFLKRASKESFSEIIARSKTVEVTENVASVAASKKPPKGPSQRASLKTKEKVKSDLRKSKFDQCSENEDPNQTGTFETKEARPETGRNIRKNLKGNAVESPAKYRITKTIPATVPQQCTRKFALEFKQYVKEPKPRATKALFGESKKSCTESITKVQVPDIEKKYESISIPELKYGSTVQVPEPDADKKTNVQVPEPAAERKYSSEFEESCRRSGDTPTCKRAIVASSDYVVEQATMLESAIKLLNLGEDGKHSKEDICTGILGVVCDETVAQRENAGKETTEPEANIRAPEPIFAFRATRDDKAQHKQTRKRKSVEMSLSKKVTFYPPPSTKVAVGNSKKLKVTCPQPFRLRTEERGALKELEFNKKMEEYVAMKEGLCMPPLPKKTPHRPRRTFRAQKSPQKEPPQSRVPSAVELSIEMVTKEQQLMQESEGNKDKPIRRQAMPSFERPFRPQRSTKKLTVPVEPKFHTIHGSRTCTKHRPTVAAQ